MSKYNVNLNEVSGTMKKKYLGWQLENKIHNQKDSIKNLSFSDCRHRQLKIQHTKRSLGLSLDSKQRSQGHSNMPVNHTAWCSARIGFNEAQWLMYWMGYEFSSASVMDYQALFQDYIQRGTLQDKTFWCKPALKSPKHLWPADSNTVWYMLLVVTGCFHYKLLYRWIS